MEVQVAKVVDVRGQYCPGPVLRARQEIEELESGQVMEVVATDPAAEPDLQAWAKWAGHQVLAVRKDDGQLRVLIRKGG
jgi:TusA-related sulfurtransferase